MLSQCVEYTKLCTLYCVHISSGYMSVQVHITCVMYSLYYECILQHYNRSLDVDTMLYIGGVEPHVPLPPFSHSLRNFDGCMSHLVMDDRIIDLASPVRRHATSVGCPPREGNCPEGSCLYGDCVSVWNGATCHCEDSPDCDETSSSSISPSISISSGGYLRLELPTGSAFTVQAFSLAFRTRETTATLVTFGTTASVQVSE